MKARDEVETLVARCIEYLDAGDSQAVEGLCSEHPEHAAVVRRRLRDLARLGILRDDSQGAAAESPLPTVVGPFRILERLGRGGMGDVFVGEQTEPIHRRVAIKLVRAGIGSGADANRRFEAERQVLARMTDSRIAQVFEVGSTPDGQPWLAMELVEGESITQYCDRHEVSLRGRLEIFNEVCRAVQHAHEQGVIHRDLKPSNVLVRHVSNGPEVRLIDFGIAKLFDVAGQENTAAATPNLTLQGALLGTPEFMSPEQASGRAEILDVRTDVYALGVMLYELLTGALPFPSERLRRVSTLEIVRILSEEEPRPPSRATTQTSPTRSSELRGDLDAVVGRALEKRPEDRYASARDLADDIDRFLQSRPVFARPPSAVQRVRKLWRRRRTACVAAIVATVAVAIASTAWIMRSVEARASRDRFEVLSAVPLLTEAREVLSAIQPSWPARIPDFEAWFAKYEEPLRAIAPRVSETRQQLVSREAQLPGSERFLLRTLTKVETDLEAAFESDDGLIARATRELEWAQGLASKKAEYRDAWTRARRELRDDARFVGLDLLPQSGLVPLGKDPETRLQEFAHLRSGAIAKRGGDDRVRIRAKHGIVFVLVPPGEWVLGCQASDPSGPNYDRRAYVDDVPTRRVRVEPFLLSKFEVTQAQWKRLTGINPSAHSAGRRELGNTATWANPVENMTPAVLRATLRSVGLELPDEDQWEVACRAGSTTVWPTGDDWKTLEGHANIGDRSLFELRTLENSEDGYGEWNDGWGNHAPVGTFSPNAFGFHDMIGNVAEWCRPYSGSTQDGIGKLVTRSGVALRSAYHNRSALRTVDPTRGSRMKFNGVRPMRRIERKSGF